MPASTGTVRNPRISPFGQLLRAFRSERSVSQLELAAKAGISTRHLSFVETGRSVPSRETVLILGEALRLSLRDRNTLLGAAGYAPAYQETPLAAVSAPIRQAIAGMLTAAGAHPSWVINRRFDVIQMNRAAETLLKTFCAEPPTATPNLARLLLSPRGLRGAIVNIERVILHVLERILREVGGVHARAPGDDEFLKELLPAAAELRSRGVQPYDTMLVPVTFLKDDLRLSLFTAITTFGSPSDVALQELRIETLFPLDEASARESALLFQ
jgi:transcriptional regulator with XRE-family HTH domain